ncbi:hypothetical protein ATCC90586_012128 [Pythium insidiosum]|nr:hypothetical protein ATCC90586_012128 [Pythium insidiosum]
MAAAAQLWIVGARGVGKQSLAQALGAQRVAPLAQDKRFRWAPTRGLSVDLVVCDDVRAARRMAGAAVALLVFDVTRKQSLDALREMASDGLCRSAARTVLVGTHVDRDAERQVQAADALHLAAPIDFDDSVDVSCGHPPFQGVAYLRQLLLAWLTEPALPLDADKRDSQALSPPASPPPLSPPLSPAGRCVRTSIWLYDPTDEVPGPDVRLRPISRALYELRVAGTDRVKLQEKKRDHVVASAIQRSRYHGPTESSRSMRWQVHAQQQDLKLRQQRSASKAIDLVATRSFLRATKLSEQRHEQLKARTTSPRPTRAASAPRGHAATAPAARKRLASPAEMAPSPPVFALELVSPGAERVAALPAPVPLQHLQSPVPPVSSPLQTVDDAAAEDEERREQDDDASELWLPLESSGPEDETANALPHSDTEDADDVAASAAAAASSDGIDALLDFFDGVTLPLE